MRTIGLLFILVCAGCGPSTALMTEPSKFNGQVMLSGQPFGDVMVNFQPTGLGQSIATNVDASGKFSCDLVPAEYVYYVSKSSSKTSEKGLEKVKSDFLEPKMANKLIAKAGQDLVVNIQ
jgi:hypothetical protein